MNKNFLNEYRQSMNHADERFVYYNNHTLELKKMEPLDAAEVKKFFDDEKNEKKKNSN